MWVADGAQCPRSDCDSRHHSRDPLHCRDPFVLEVPVKRRHSYRRIHHCVPCRVQRHIRVGAGPRGRNSRCGYQPKHSRGDGATHRAGVQVFECPELSERRPVPARPTAPFLPGRVWSGAVEEVLPALGYHVPADDPLDRSIQIRTVADDPPRLVPEEIVRVVVDTPVLGPVISASGGGDGPISTRRIPMKNLSAVSSVRGTDCALGRSVSGVSSEAPCAA